MQQDKWRDYGAMRRDYTPDELEFMKAVEQHKREKDKNSLTWSEVLEIAKALGYQKVAEPTALPLVGGRAKRKAKAKDSS